MRNRPCRDPATEFDDVREMFFNLPFGNAQAVREVPGGTPHAGNRLDDLLPDGQLGIRPAGHYSNSVGATP
jgi:hypothetical protein